MPKPLSLTHKPQEVDGYCLPTCVQMVLGYIELSYSQATLSELMESQLPIGTLRSNIKKLTSLQIDIIYDSGNLKDIEKWLNQNSPVIVFLDAGELPHWHHYDFTQQVVIQHAIVVVGLDSQTIYLMDPAINNGPTSTPIGDFILAWDEMDNYYAILTKQRT